MKRSPNRERAAMMYAAGQTYRHIAGKLGVSAARVHRYIREHDESARIVADHDSAVKESRLIRAYRKCPRCGRGFYNLSGGRRYCGKRCKSAALKELRGSAD